MPLMHSRVAHVVLVLVVCAAVYWPLLGVSGFGASEGHRVGPAWEMLATGDWVHLRLFDQTYLRKPPGMPWAIAVSSSIFGQTEFAARAVSALASTIMALLALWFTNRWLGPPWGLAGGLAQAFTPMIITIGRTAEIDPLNCLGTQVAAFALLSLLALPSRGPRVSSLVPHAPLLLALGIILAGVAKGPASVPVVIGIVAGACILFRSLSPLRNRGMWLGVASAGAIVGAMAAWFTDMNRDPDAVTQDFSEFTWSLSRLAETALLVPAAMAAAIPTSAALLVLFFHQRDPKNREGDVTLPMARLLALSWLLSVGVFMLFGVSNPRYAMPAGVLLAPLAAWAIRACWMARGHSRLARGAILGHPVIPAGVMLALAVAWIVYDASRPRHQAGRAAGAAIAAHLPDEAVVWANDLVEARPDVLLYTMSAARREGRDVHPRWRKSDMLRARVPAPSEGPHVYLLLRDDEESDELRRYAAAVESGELTPAASGEIVKYRWVLLRAHASASIDAEKAPPPEPVKE